jgi:hypothetical protein
MQYINQVASKVVPEGSRVMVVSRGDPAFLDLRGREGWHFPRAADGGYAGHHPASGAEAIAHLEELRARGGDYLLLPESSFWWLDYYEDFAAHLANRYERVWSDETVVIVRLTAKRGGQNS